MRPDRIVVGECRSGEALDMLQAMNTGHDGSLTTAHANTPRDTLSRLEVMCLMSGMDLPVRAIREQIASAVDMICQQNRLRDGSRKIEKIAEVQGMEGEVITMSDIFEFEQTGIEGGKIIGASARRVCVQSSLTVSSPPAFTYRRPSSASARATKGHGKGLAVNSTRCSSSSAMRF